MRVSQNQIKLIKEFCSIWDINVKFTKMKIGGEAHCVKNTIIIRKTYQDIDEMWSVVCHEIAHILCYRSGVFIKYHTALNTKDVRNCLSTAFRAEKYTDKQGSVLFKQFFPDLKYNWTYVGNRNKVWIKEYLKNLEDFY
jgi:predicted metallopeptidase